MTNGNVIPGYSVDWSCAAFIESQLKPGLTPKSISLIINDAEKKFRAYSNGINSSSAIEEYTEDSYNFMTDGH